MNRKRTSFAFLTEMLWVCGFFVLAACVFVLAFVKADQTSKDAENLNHAVLIASNTIEDTFSELKTGTEPAGDRLLYFDQSWNEADSSSTAISFLVTVSAESEDGLLKVTAKVDDHRGKNIYTLDGVHYEE